MQLLHRIYYTLTKTLIVLALMLLGTGHVFGQSPPVSNFSANITSGCAPLTVNFSDQSSGNPTGWNWEFSNGTLSSVQNPSVTFSAPGTYSVKLVVQNANGIAELERINYITVFPSPTPDFTSNLSLGCVPSTITFTDLSAPAGSITKWEWDFGDGGTSTQQNPTHTYNNVGFYSVTLAVTSNTGCRTVISKGSFIRIVGSIFTDFSFTQPSTCQAPFAVNFANQSNGPGTISYNWDFGDGQTSGAPNPTNIYGAAGSYTVTLNAQSDLGCSGSIQKTVTITSTATNFNAPANICLNQPAAFQNASSANPVSSFWNFGDGTTSGSVNPVKTFLVPGTYDVKLINRYANCIDSITKQVTVIDKPVVDFIADDSTSCSAPFTVQFTDRTAGATAWLWNFGDGSTSTQQNPSHTYNAMGNYTVTLTVTTAAGCTNTFAKTNYIQIQKTVVQINAPTGGCIPFTYVPIATVTTLDPIVSYTWNLGEPGAIFNVANPPPYTYNIAGIFTVSLTVVTQSGCTVTTSIPDGVRTGVQPVPAFSFAPPSACAKTPVGFVDETVFSPLASQGWQWDFGDGTMSLLQNPTHQFEDTGQLTITLTAYNNRCTARVSHVIDIRPPIAKFDYTINCATNQVTFADQSIFDPLLAPLTFEWDFGNGNTFIGRTPPPQTYMTPGVYHVSLKVTNGTCDYTYLDDITIAAEPADFSASKQVVCKGEQFTLQATTSNPANIATYAWVIDNDTLPDRSRTITHSIATSGTYTVTLVLTDINGCRTLKTMPNYIVVNGPTANFNPAAPGACLTKPITFTDLSLPAGNIRNWTFDFGDGTQQSFTAPPFTHVYNKLGGFMVSLTVTDAAGCQNTYNAPNPLLVTNPVAGFRADTFYCPQAPLQFIDTSFGAGLTYLWTFSDGGTANVQNPQHSFPLGDADYSVKLRITDISGCMDSITKTNYVKIRSPKAAFDIRDTTTICPPLRTSFTFQGADYTSFLWDFGDGGQSTIANPSYYYGTYGQFTPTLYVYGAGGCVESATAHVTVHNPNLAQMNYGPPLSACNSLNVDFNLVVPPGFKFIVYLGDGAVDSTRRTSFSHFYPRPSLNAPTLIILDTVAGCSAGVYGPNINVLGAIPLFSKDKKELCDNGLVTFKDFTTKNEPIISNVWDFGDGGTSNATDPTHFYNQPGVYLVALDVTTQSNCSNRYTDTVRVYRTPIPSILSRDTFCVNVAEPIEGMLAQADTLTNWQWTFGNGQGSPNQNNMVTYTTPGEYTLQLTATNKIGCSTVVTKKVVVMPPPSAVPVVDPITIISGASTNLAMTYTGNIVSYNWVPTTRLSCTTCPTPLANPQMTTKYTVEMVDNNGCRNSGNITVVVVCNNQNFFVPNTFSPNGDGQNDIFFPRGTGLYNIKSLMIFNRWGQMIFERKSLKVNDPASGWDGTFNGQKASPDVYVYMLEILCDNGVVIPVKGNVTLLR